MSGGFFSCFRVLMSLEEMEERAATASSSAGLAAARSCREGFRRV
jgi:hypothetical protein